MSSVTMETPTEILASLDAQAVATFDNLKVPLYAPLQVEKKESAPLDFVIFDYFPEIIQRALDADGMTFLMRNIIDLSLKIRVPESVTTVQELNEYFNDRGNCPADLRQIRDKEDPQDREKELKIFFKYRTWIGLPESAQERPRPSPSDNDGSFNVDLYVQANRDVTFKQLEYLEGTMGVNWSVDEVLDYFGWSEDEGYEMLDEDNMFTFLRDRVEDMLSSNGMGYYLSCYDSGEERNHETYDDLASISLGNSARDLVSTCAENFLEELRERLGLDD